MRGKWWQIQHSAKRMTDKHTGQAERCSEEPELRRTTQHGGRGTCLGHLHNVGRLNRLLGDLWLAGVGAQIKARH